MNEIIIGSKNPGKVVEIKQILSLANVEFLDLHGLSFTEEIEEKGATFGENALLKAETIYKKYRIPVIADDSGLSVSYLNGSPGVYSARFAGSGATDEKNNRLLLEKLRDVPDGMRNARFICVALFYYATARYHIEEGSVDGYITTMPEGDGGFGYDPLFFLPELGKTMAQLPPDVKNSISHRACAFKRLRPRIVEYLR